MSLIDCRETSVTNYHYSLRNNPEERSSQENTFPVSLASFEIIMPNRLSTILHFVDRATCNDFW